MLEFLGIVGITAGVVLAVLLATNLKSPALGLWPTHEEHRWKTMGFWVLFRLANVSALGLASGNLWRQEGWSPLQGTAITVAVLIGAGYVWACIYLGRDNLYCGQAGLVTAGVYRWTRNPQYAAAMPAYTALAIAAPTLELAATTSLLIAIFHLMARNEEPWLQSTYGEQYRIYQSRVPRYYNFSRLLAVLWLELRRVVRDRSYR